jgi:hypothetical protein
MVTFASKSFFFFFSTGVLNSGPTPWGSPPALFWTVFWDRVLRTTCPGWLWTVILLISASWVAQITDMSHWCLAYKVKFTPLLCLAQLIFYALYWKIFSCHKIHLVTYIFLVFVCFPAGCRRYRKGQAAGVCLLCRVESSACSLEWGPSWAQN